MQYLQPRGAGVRFPNASDCFFHSKHQTLNITPPHLQHSHGENLAHLNGLPIKADGATCLGEVPHLSCESSQEKKRLYGGIGNPTKVGDLTYPGSPTSM